MQVVSQPSAARELGRLLQRTRCGQGLETKDGGNGQKNIYKQGWQSRSNIFKLFARPLREHLWVNPKFSLSQIDINAVLSENRLVRIQPLMNTGTLNPGSITSGSN